MQILQRIGGEVNGDPAKLATALSWARDMVSVKDFEKVNSLYFLVYTDMAMRSAGTVPPSSRYYMAYSKAAYQALVTFEVMFMTDAARCVNPNANATAPTLLQSRYFRAEVRADGIIARPGNGNLLEDRAELRSRVGQPPR